MVDTYNPSTGKTEREDHKIQVSLGCIVRYCLKNQTKEKSKEAPPSLHHLGPLPAQSVGKEMKTKYIARSIYELESTSAHLIANGPGAKHDLQTVSEMVV